MAPPVAHWSSAMKKLALLLALLSTPAFAAPLASLEADLDADGKADTITLSRQDDSDYLLLEIGLASGQTIESRKLVRGLRTEQLSVTPMGLLVSTIEDQSSAAQAYDYLIYLENGRAALGAFEFHYDYPSGIAGACQVTPASGVAIVNGEASEFTPRTESIAQASGTWYESLCHELAVAQRK